MNAKRVFLSAFCAVAALTAGADSKILWEESVSDAEDALIIVGDVRDGAALVVGPISGQGQFEGLADEFGPSGVPSLGKD